MNTITTDTIKNLGFVADLNAAKLSGEGWSPRFSNALTSERHGKVIFKNGAVHELVLPIGTMRKWAGLLDAGLPHRKHADPEIGVEFEANNRLTLLHGPSRITFNSRDPKSVPDLPTYTLDAGPAPDRIHDPATAAQWHEGEFKLVGGPASLEEIKGLRKTAAVKRKQVACEKLLGKERQALERLRDGAQSQCERLARLARVPLAEAVAEAKRFRDLRRFARKTLADPTVKPEWLLTEGKVHPADDVFVNGYTATSESENYDLALAKYQAAKAKCDSYKPKHAWSRVADAQKAKRAQVAGAALSDLNGILESALARRFGDNTDPKLDGWRQPKDAAYSWWTGNRSYHETRRGIRNWKSHKAELATVYLLARQRRLDAQKGVTA